MFRTEKAGSPEFPASVFQSIPSFQTCRFFHVGSTPSNPTPIITFEMDEGFVKCKEDHCAWGLLREISFDRVHMEVKYLEIN